MTIGETRENTFKPQVRGGYSDRNGIKTINTSIQIEKFDLRTRKVIMKVIDLIMDYIVETGYGDLLFRHIYYSIFNSTKDEIPEYNQYSYQHARFPIYEGIITTWDYDDILTFLESFISWLEDQKVVVYTNDIVINDFEKLFNDIFKTECVGYRIIDGKATRIIDDEELLSINKSTNCKYDACSKSIQKAIKYLYDRKEPDYENSVKESISSIEAMCNIINGTRNDSLGDALNKLEKSGVTIHGAMKDAFKSLYGYTSNKSGIRHNAGIDEKTTFEEAQYMLITCSAFLNYLIALYENSIKK